MKYLTDREVRMMADMAALTYLHQKTCDRYFKEITFLASACIVFFLALVMSIAR